MDLLVPYFFFAVIFLFSSLIIYNNSFFDDRHVTRGKSVLTMSLLISGLVFLMFACVYYFENKHRENEVIVEEIDVL